MMTERRTRVEETVHDGLITHPVGCPKGANDCEPLSRVASPGYESFMCCGETHPEGRRSKPSSEPRSPSDTR